MRNRNNAPDSVDDDAAPSKDAASPDYLVDSKLKRKIDPRSMIKLKKYKKVVADVEATDDNASHNAMDNANHAPNNATALDADNKTPVRQLLDGREYPVAKGDIIKKVFDCEVAVERYVDYLNGLSQLPGCTSYTCDRITSCT